MDQAPFRGRGGDTHTPQARLDIARREEQTVALRLRRIPFSAIARPVGINKSNVVRAFNKALRRSTEQNLSAHHRIELAELEVEQANIWRAMDANKENWQAQMSGTAQLRGIHIRRAKLLGLDAPYKLDVSGIYRSGADEMSDEHLENQRAWARLPLD